jgi:hypothetical protein
MRCIFCKDDSSTSRSEEHIVPETLGNSRNILPPGIVCDQCNNYFARKIEKPVLDSGFFTVTRFTQALPNKRGRVPTVGGIIEPGGPIEVSRNPEGRFLPVNVPPQIFQKITTSKRGFLILPTAGSEPEPYIFSRFLSKMALEAMAQKLLKKPELLASLIDDPQLDPIRNHARRGDKRTQWPFYKRRIYEENHKQMAENETSFQVLYEYNLFLTRRHELYFAIALFGIEYVINIGGPDIEGYEEWLHENENRSPLYP